MSLWLHSLSASALPSGLLPLAQAARATAAPLPLRRQRSDVGAFRRLLAAASPAWLTDPAANLTLLVPVDLAMQHSVLLVAAFAGPGDQGGPAHSSSTTDPTSEGGPKASAEQLLGVYQLQRSLPLSDLAALNGSLLPTRAADWALCVHAGAPSADGVRERQRRSVGL